MIRKTPSLTTATIQRHFWEIQPAEYVGAVPIEDVVDTRIVTEPGQPGGAAVVPLGVIRIGDAEIPWRGRGHAAVYVRRYRNGLIAEVALAQHDGLAVEDMDAHPERFEDDDADEDTRP